MAVSAYDLSQQSFPSMPMPAPYDTVIGNVWPGFQMLVWGPKGAGKSTQTLLMAASLVPHAVTAGGTVMIVAAEEGKGVGVQRRLDRVGIPDEVSEHMMIEEWKGMDHLRQSMKEHDVKWVVIDSISVVPVASLDLIDYCRSHDIGSLLVAHARKGGWTYKGNSKIGHEVDAVILCHREDDGEGRYMISTKKNRALDEPPPSMPAPKNVAAISSVPSAEEVMRENPDCSPDEGEKQSQQCMAIMASLRAEGELNEEFKDDDTEEATAEDIEEVPDPEETDVAAEEVAEDMEEDGGFEFESTEEGIEMLLEQMEESIK